jgi:NAD(P)-dependent dehydrogenase (short-subunit alcohol dehydrogenase family)
VVQADLGEPDGPGRLIAMAGDRLDVLVNNVGSAPARPGCFLSITDTDWQRTLNLNLMAAVR